MRKDFWKNAGDYFMKLRLGLTKNIAVLCTLIFLIVSGG